MRTSHLISLAAAVVLAVPAAAQASGPPQPSCGATITVDTKLHRDLVDCPDNGIVIGADDVTLDLNGHVIDGDGTEFTDCPPDEACDIGVVDFDHHGVTIKGGKVSEFTFGAIVAGASDGRVSRLVVSKNLWSGLLVADSSRSEIDGVTASKNGLTTDQAGIDVFDSQGLRIARNTVVDSGDIGFFISGLDDSRVEKNVLSRNPEAAILLDHGNGNEFSQNRISAGVENGIVVSGDANTVAGNLLSGTAGCPSEECGYGISLEGGTGNVLERNTVVRFHRAGIRVASFESEGGPPTRGNTVRRNLIRDAEVDGVLVESTAAETLLERNVALAAGDDGIDLESAATVVTRNLALHSGDLGIEAVPGVTDGGGNRAAANGNPAQCVNVAC